MRANMNRAASLRAARFALMSMMPPRVYAPCCRHMPVAAVMRRGECVAAFEAYYADAACNAYVATLRSDIYMQIRYALS